MTDFEISKPMKSEVYGAYLFRVPDEYDPDEEDAPSFPPDGSKFLDMMAGKFSIDDIPKIVKYFRTRGSERVGGRVLIAIGEGREFTLVEWEDATQ